MKTFIKSLISEKGAISSKRFLSLFSLGLLTIFIIITFCGVETKEYQFWGLISIIASMQGITTIDKFKKK